MFLACKRWHPLAWPRYYYLRTYSKGPTAARISTSLGLGNGVGLSGSSNARPLGLRSARALTVKRSAAALSFRVTQS
eukprot:6188770-Pleurochrysis_carterae.AAC.1